MKRTPLYLFFVLVTASCIGKLPEKEDISKLTAVYVPTAEQQKISAMGNEFAFDVSKELAYAQNGNVLFSPLALRLSLAMAECGAVGSTRVAVHDAAGFGSFSLEEICGYFHSVLNRVGNSDANVAGSLWTDKRLKCNSQYSKIAKTIFYADSESFDNISVGRRLIDSWASKVTEGKVQSVASNLSEDCQSVWASSFAFEALLTADKLLGEEGLVEDFFYSSKGGVVNLKRGSFIAARLNNRKIYRSTDYYALALGFSNSDFSMYIILPRETSSVESVLSSMNADTWNDITCGNFFSNVDLYLPKFEMVDDVDAETLMSIFAERGMSVAFSENANFSSIASSATSAGAFVTGAAFEIKTQGGEYATTVSQLHRQNSDVLEFKADHPFVYYLVDNNTGAILLVGIQRTI